VKRLAVILFGLGLGALGASAAKSEEASPTPAAKGPRISVEPASFDFGKAVQRKTLQKEFRLRNFGDQDLVIEQVSTTCGCTVAQGFAHQVKPGDSTSVRVSLETRDYRGRLVRSVLVRSNDPETKVLEIRVEATVSAAR
jgi:hypothetical protein